jgi:hypothetical protein
MPSSNGRIPAERQSPLVRRDIAREEWDSNPRDPSPGPTVFKTVAFVRSAILPSMSLSGEQVHAPTLADRRRIGRTR